MTNRFAATEGLSRRRFLRVAGAGLVTAATASGALFRLTSAQAGEGRFRLTILHINDLHSRIEPVTAADSTCGTAGAAAGECFGGVARLATSIRSRREALAADGRHVVTLDAGDQFQGSLFYTTYKGLAEVEFMNRIGFDAMALGNHEFDHGSDVLADFVAAAGFPVISGNTIVATEERLAGLLGEWAILDRGGTKIGILSALTPATATIATPGPNIRFRDEIEYLGEAVGRIRGAGADKVLLLSHVGFRRDQEVAAAVEGIAAIIGGHSHTLLSNSADGAPPYATLVENPAGRAVPIVQAYAYSRYLGEIELAFDEEGYVVDAAGDTIPIGWSVEPDPEIEARVAALAGPIETLKATPVATLKAPIDGSRESCRSRECTLGNLVADAMLARTVEQGSTIAIHNGGGLRASLYAGAVTLGDILTALPFQNTIATMQLSGADIVASLEHAVSGVEEGSGAFPQVAGLRFSFDPRVPPDRGRVRSVEVIKDEEWAPIEPDRLYGVVTHSFLRKGGDGYGLFASNARDVYDYGPLLEDAVAAYLAANEPYSPRIEGRIVNLAERE